MSDEDKYFVFWISYGAEGTLEEFDTFEEARNRAVELDNQPFT